MSIYADLMDDDLGFAEGELGSIMVFAGDDCQVIADDEMEETDFDERGEYSVRTRTVIYRRSRLDQHPAPRSRVSLDGVGYTVESVEQDSDGVSVSLNLRRI